MTDMTTVTALHCPLQHYSLDPLQRLATSQRNTNCKLVFLTKSSEQFEDVGSAVKWLKHRAYDQHGLGLKLIRVILQCPWERYFRELFPSWGLGKQF